jgi:hypothetical protein
MNEALKFSLHRHLSTGCYSVTDSKSCNNCYGCHANSPPNSRVGKNQSITHPVCNILRKKLSTFQHLLSDMCSPFLTRSRKLQLIGLFSVGFIVVAITIVRLDQNYATGAFQINRTIWASGEYLASAFVANMPTLYTLRRRRRPEEISIRSRNKSDSAAVGADRQGITVTRSIELEEQYQVPNYPSIAMASGYTESWNQRTSQDDLTRVCSIHTTLLHIKYG